MPTKSMSSRWYYELLLKSPAAELLSTAVAKLRVLAHGTNLPWAHIMYSKQAICFRYNMHRRAKTLVTSVRLTLLRNLVGVFALPPCWGVSLGLPDQNVGERPGVPATARDLSFSATCRTGVLDPSSRWGSPLPAPGVLLSSVSVRLGVLLFLNRARIAAMSSAKLGADGANEVPYGYSGHRCVGGATAPTLKLTSFDLSCKPCQITSDAKTSICSLLPAKTLRIDTVNAQHVRLQACVDTTRSATRGHHGCRTSTTAA